MAIGYNRAVMEIYLIRHGQSQANAGLTDELDSDLTELGQEQARRTAERLRGEGLTRAYVSPLRRTLETISFLCAATGLRAEVTAEVCEFFSAHYPGYRTFQGLSPEEITAQFSFADFGQTFPCEPKWWPQEPEDDQIIYDRCVQVRDMLLQEFGQTADRLVLVSHAETVGRLIEAFLRVPPHPQDPPWSDNCGVTRLSCPLDSTLPATLIYGNNTSHLAGLLSP